MKGLLFFGAFALLAFVSCKDIDVPYVPEDTSEETHDEAWYAANATISSSDAHFAYTEEGEGTISFKAEGGSVVVYVDCGTEWTAENSAADIFDCEVQSASITVTAEQNLVEEELYGTITLMTIPSQIHFATISITQNAYGAPEITVSTNEWNIPAVAATAEELTTEIGVEATDEWEVECDAEWLTAEKGGDGGESVILTAAENETFEERVAEVVLTCADGYNSDSETITVTQDARAYITLSAEEFEFGKMGGEAEVTVESNYEWSYACESDWFTVSENTDGSLTITVDVNRTGDDREGAVVFTAGDGTANVASTTLTIAQGIEDPDALILEYTITSDGTEEIQLPLGERDNAGHKYDIDCTVDWGDGSEVEAVTGSFPSHTYSEAGTYTVIINGKVELLCSYDFDKRKNIDGRNCLTAVGQWGDLGVKSMVGAFYDCENLTSLPDGSGPFENVTTFYAAFEFCTSLKDVPVGLFSNCTAAEDFEYVFDGCSSLTSAPSFKGLSNATDFNKAFRSCTSLTTVPEGMFSNCTAAERFTDAFAYCTALTTLPENMFSNCSSATKFQTAFSNCSSLTSVPENLFADCLSVGSFYGVFWNCSSLESDLVGVFDNNKLVTDFKDAFGGCSNLKGESPCTEIDVTGTSVKVHLYERANYPDYFTAPTSYSGCFRDCSKLDDYDDIPDGWK